MNSLSPIFLTENQHRYIYSDALQYFLYVPTKLRNAMEEKFVETNDYYIRKLHFLQKHSFFDKASVNFQTTYTEELVKQNIACLRQLLIEVTDSCNLKCKYCGYGEFYSNYDQRETCNQTFDNVKILIDYLAELWSSDYNTSHNNSVIIGFYGGEPLLNMKLIQETIAYIESLALENLKFKYNMTTNALLLDRYIDFLVKKNFTLLISLDGNEYQSSYRVDKSGRPSFARVARNIQRIRNSYPLFYENNVNFNAVLHNRNSVEGCLHSIYDTFGKRPIMSELNTNGVIPERISEFIQMFNDKAESFKVAMAHDSRIKNIFSMEDTDSISYHTVIMNYSGNRYTTYVDMFNMEQNRYIPTGTCRAFERKLFLTVNGKILPCEKIGQKNVIARLLNGKLHLDCNAIARYYSSLYEKIVVCCTHCNVKRSCGQCLFLLGEKDGKLICPGIQSDAKQKKEFSTFLTYAEQNPGDYERLLSSIVID